MLAALASLPPRLRPAPVRERRFEGSSGGRRLASAGVMPAAPASVLAARGRLAARTRYLSANSPLAASTVLGWVGRLVGSGIVAQSAHPSPAVPAAAPTTEDPDVHAPAETGPRDAS